MIKLDEIEIKCDYCGAKITPGTRPDGYPNAVGFELKDGTIITVCYHCICSLPGNPKMQKWIDSYRGKTK